MYLGGERAPAWLRTDYFARRLGGNVGIEKLLRLERQRMHQWQEELNDRDIARALGMCEGQVAKVLWRLRRGRLLAGIGQWMAALAESQVESGMA